MDIASQDAIDDEGQEIVKLKKNDLMGEIGFGIDFYLEYFKFSLLNDFSYIYIFYLSLIYFY